MFRFVGTLLTVESLFLKYNIMIFRIFVGYNLCDSFKRYICIKTVSTEMLNLYYRTAYHWHTIPSATIVSIDRPLGDLSYRTKRGRK